MDYEVYRGSEGEKAREADIMRLAPAKGAVALDVGARDGHFSVLLTGRFDEVIALDLEQPTIDHPKVRCVKGNAAELAFADGSMDFVLCAEVLEHIPPAILSKVCSEMERTCRGKLLIGVPYRQDTRVGRTTCASCGTRNPPWAHLNTFDEARLVSLFPRCRVDEISFVGKTRERTNAVAAFLMDLAGNPYGTYVQEEGCMNCGRPLVPPQERGIAKRALTRLAMITRGLTEPLAREHGNWIHILFSRN